MKFPQKHAKLANATRRAMREPGPTPPECVPHAERATFSKAALPNGIVLPEPWPPPGRSYADFVSDPPQWPQEPPQPPPVVRIDVGRQCFAALTCEC